MTVRTPESEWSICGLDSVAARVGGHVTVPFDQFILKLASRCNLNCTYCYVYHSPDQSWRTQPRVMSQDTVAMTVRRIAEHITAHRLPSVRVGLHGGEPLLAGVEVTEQVLTAFTRGFPAEARIEVGVQTNGVLLDRRFLELFLHYGTRVSVSLDGDATATDRHRRRHDGRSSYPAVVRALRLLAEPSYRPLFAGLLCTVDLANDPVSVYESLLEFAPPTIDFLLPHGNWTRRPPGQAVAETPYAAWLIAVFDHWYTARRKRTSIRLFDEMIHLLLGGVGGGEALGTGAVNFVVVETDGAIEQSDSLKSAYLGAAGTGLSVWTDPFDAAFSHPGVAAQQSGLAGLCPSCLECPVRDICGGGLYAHRYRAGHGFRNPSVYCADLRALIEHVASRLYTDLIRLRDDRR